MQRLLVSALALASVVSALSFGMLAFGAAPAAACEKHLNGHQSGSDTDWEGSRN